MDTIADIFSGGIQGFLTNVLNSGLKLFDFMLKDLSTICFFSQDYMTNNMKMNFGSIFTVVRSFGLYLIILKLLIKGFNTYILWSDGDSDLDPFNLATGFFKAIIIAVSFNTIYKFGINIALDFMTKVLNSVNQVDLASISITMIIGQFMSQGMVLLIFAIIYVVCFVMLWIQFIKRGLEIFTLKLGIPLACVGLMDSDGGIFKAYVKKFFQEVFAVIMQIFFLKLSIALMINGHIFWGIAAISFALKTPQFLQDFILAYGGGQGAVQKTSQAVYAANMVRSFVAS